MAQIKDGAQYGGKTGWHLEIASKGELQEVFHLSHRTGFLQNADESLIKLQDGLEECSHLGVKSQPSG